jgi:type II secretory pathway component PulF
MNPQANRAFKDYASLLAYLIPCSIVIGFANFILIPRFERVAEAFGADIPATLATLIHGVQFFFDHFWLVLAIVLLLVIAAEFYSGFWRARRRILLGILQWLVVFSTMIALAILGTSALALQPL